MAKEKLEKRIMLSLRETDYQTFMKLKEFVGIKNDSKLVRLIVLHQLEIFRNEKKFLEHDDIVTSKAIPQIFIEKAIGDFIHTLEKEGFINENLFFSSKSLKE